MPEAMTREQQQLLELDSAKSTIPSRMGRMNKHQDEKNNFANNGPQDPLPLVKAKEIPAIIANMLMKV